MEPSSPSVLIIGAGPAGLRCAELLAAAGRSLTVVDKGRGPGARASTRRLEDRRFDHGAQYFTARDPRFRERLAGWESAGVIARWDPALVQLRPGANPEPREPRERWVGTPSMSAWIRSLAEPLGARYKVWVTALAGGGGGWRATAEGPDGAEDLGPFDQLVLAIPAPQAAALLGADDPLAARLAEVVMAPCWTAMLDFARRVAVDWDAAMIEESPLSWAAREASKPGRASGYRWVLHGTADWSRERLESDKAVAASALLDAFTRLVGTLPPAIHSSAHRWAYARTQEALGEDAVFDAERGLGLCGDWCRGERIEDAYLSGEALGRLMAEG